MYWTVEEFAKITGLPESTFHSYEEIGLLVPSHFSDKGHKCFGKEDLARLQQILSLKQFEMSLDEIKKVLCGAKE
jgi:MerR family transcriptional regulator, thiopeptide resistance regulator